MNPTSIKWLIAGLAGALVSLALVGGAGYFAYTKIQGELGSADHWIPEEFAKSLEEAERSANRREKEQRKREATIKRLRLHDHYETVYLLPATRNLLYYEKDFAAADAEIAAIRAMQDTPYDRYRYSCLIESLGHIFENEDYRQLLAVLDEWIAASPDSYIPLLVRAHLYVNVAWDYRGMGAASRVTEDGWEGYHEYHQKAWADLNAAREINQEDPEIPAAMARAAVGAGMDLGDIQRYHDETLALNPHHLGVRNTLMNYSLPKWLGDWEKIDALIAEFEQAAGAFPYLVTLLADTADMMRVRGPRYFAGSDSDAMQQRLLAGMKAQLKQNPDEPWLLASVARRAHDMGDLPLAAACFERLGARYPRVNEYADIYVFHWLRIRAFVEHSDDPGIIGTPREKELLDLARATHSDDPYVNGMYLAYLARARDDAQTRAFFERDPGAFFLTSDLGEPYDYDLLRAMALAARSDDYGVQGTPEEIRLLAEAMALAPENAFVRLIQAEHHTTANDFERSQPHLDHARSADPDYLPALLTEGWLHYHRKRWDDGIATANAFLARAPAQYVLDNTSQAEEIIALCKKKRAAEQQNAS